MVQRRAAVSMLAVVLAAAVSSSTVAPAAAAPQFPAGSFGYLRESSRLGGPPVVTGVVRDERRRPVAEAEITLLVQPSEDVIAAMRVGDSVKIVPAGRTRPDRDGRFALRIDPDVPARQLVGKAGWVNFAVLVGSPAGQAYYAFSRHARPSSAPAAGAPLDFDDPVDARLDPILTVARAPAATRGGRGVPAPAGDRVACVKTLQLIYPPVWDYVGELYTGPNQTVDLVYSQGAESTLGVGLSLSGRFGEWSAAGTTTNSSDDALNFARLGVNGKRVQKTQWEYGRFLNTCWYDQGFSSRWYTAETYDWFGGSDHYTPASYPTATTCAPYRAGDGQVIAGQTAVTWTNGLRIGAYIGLDLSTRTGFSSRAKQDWVFVRDGRLCGTDGLGPLRAPTVVGK